MSLVSYGQTQKEAIANKVNDNSKYSACMSDNGKHLVIGDYEAYNNNSKSGSVRVYKSIDGIWTQIGNDIKGEAAGDWSGYSVSISNTGDTVAIGAKRNYGSNGVNSGHVRVYKNNSGIWKQIGEDIDGKVEGGWSGYSVSLSNNGTVLAVGAVLNDTYGLNSGQVCVYKMNSGVWRQIGEDINGKTTGDYFGASVSLSNNGAILAIGAHQAGAMQTGGYVSVYENVLGHWIQISKDIVGDPIGSFFGWNINLSNNGTDVAIAAHKNDEKGKRQAYVRVYVNMGNTWVQKGADIDGITKEYDVLSFNNINLSDNNIMTLTGAFENSKEKNKPMIAIEYERIYKYEQNDNMWNQISTHM